MNIREEQVGGVGALGEGWCVAPTLSDGSNTSHVLIPEFQRTLNSVCSELRELGAPISGSPEFSELREGR
eukprot:7292027-Alexandrium_andersonii.AAC.1